MTITLATTIIPLLVAGIYFIHENRLHLLQLTRERLALQARLRVDAVKQDLLTPTVEFISEIEGRSRVVSNGNIEEVLSRYPTIRPYVVFVAEIQSLNPYLENAWYQSLQINFFPDSLKSDLLAKINSGQKERIFFTYQAPDSAKYLFVAAGTRDSQLRILAIDLDQFFAGLMQQHNLQPEPENVTYLDLDNGLILYRHAPSGPGIVAYSDSIWARDWVPSHEHSFDFAAEGEGKCLASFSDLNDGVHWRVVVDVPSRIALATINVMWFNFLALILFGMLLSFLGTTYYWKKIAGPLDRFARSATEIARGDFNQKIEIDSDDEIGRLARIFNYMVIELRRLNRMNLNKIISEKNKTQTIIRNIADGVIVTNNANHIVTINSAVEKWFKIKEKEVADKPIERVLPIPELLELLAEIRETELEGTFTKEITITLPRENKQRIFQARATRISGEEDHAMGVVTVLRDITREKEIDRMKTELVSLVAHELRSPLASISGFAELLQMPDESPDAVREYATIIRDEANRLADLVNKFLDITKIEAGRMDFHPTRIPIGQVLNGMLHLASTQAQQKNIRLSVNVENEDAEIYADEKMLSEVVLNLLSNAIKYSPPDTEVSVSISENEKSVILTVSDQGYGIAPQHLPKIFDKFYRIKDDPRIQDERGTGLGLALVKEIVELHKGVIKVESEVGKGTTFTVILPKSRKTTTWRP